MKDHARKFSVERMSQVFKVSRSGYYKFERLSLSKRALRNNELIKKIKKIHEESRGTYGSPRIWAALKLQGENCSRKCVYRLMKQEGISAKMKKRFKKTTCVNPKAKVAPNLLRQDFTALAPDTRWVADITYVWTKEGWLYVAAILDLFSRKIVGLAMQETLATDLILNALNQAITHRNPKEGLIHHSDKGCQYTRKEFGFLLNRYGIIMSVSGKGNCFDNAAMESFFHTLKTEHIYFQNYYTRKEAIASIFEWIEIFYNRKRLHSTLGYVSPVDFEKKWQKNV